MKVWEYIRDLKHSKATKENICDWFLMNRIEPIECLTCDNDDPIGNAQDALELGKGFILNKHFIKLIKSKKYEYGSNINLLLEEEI